ncbi:hypothetical protein KIPB_008002, partial [Kipferlia bialata]
HPVFTHLSLSLSLSLPLYTLISGNLSEIFVCTSRMSSDLAQNQLVDVLRHKPPTLAFIHVYVERLYQSMLYYDRQNLFSVIGEPVRIPRQPTEAERAALIAKAAQPMEDDESSDDPPSFHSERTKLTVTSVCSLADSLPLFFRHLLSDLMSAYMVYHLSADTAEDPSQASQESLEAGMVLLNENRAVLPPVEREKLFTKHAS